MGIHAIIFGGIGALVETSELQRKAFNSAFADAGISWRWDRDTYRRLLTIAGGRNRLRHFATASGSELSEDQVRFIHAQKSELFLDALDRQTLPLRTGVQRLINKATNSDVRVAIASTTSRSNIVTLARAARLDLDLFEVVLDRSSAEKPKPAPDIYQRCLELLGTSELHAVAIEDSDSGVAAALSAGLRCIALPGENTAEQDFSSASLVIDSRSANDESFDRIANEFSPRISGLDLDSCERLVAAIR